MKKFPFKVLTLATLATVITATTGNTIHAFAQETTAQEQKVGNYALGPEGLKKALAETGSHILVMDLYAKTMIKQPNVNLSNIDLGSEGGELLKNIHLNQELSRINANYWLDTAKPQIQKTARNIVNYDEQFQNYYDTLVETVQKKDKAGLKEGINDLITTINTNSKEVTDVIKMLQDFKGKLYQNSTDFKNNVGGLSALGAAGIGLGTAAGVTASKHMDSYNEISNKIGELSMKADRANQAVLSLTNAKETLAYLYQTVDQAILSLTNIQKQWNTMGANYTDLLDNIDSMQDHKFSLIPDDLKAAKESWNDIHKDAEFISKDIAFKQE